MTCNLNSKDFRCNGRKLTETSVISCENEEECLKIPTRGRKLNNLMINSCNDSCKNTACDSSDLKTSITSNTTSTKYAPNLHTRISRVQDDYSRSNSTRRSRNPNRSNGNIARINISIKSREIELKRNEEEKNCLRVKKEIEESIARDIEKILLEIYSNNLSNRNYDISKYENTFNLTNNSKEKTNYLLYILKTLDSKICIHISNFKDMILNKEAYSALKESLNPLSLEFSSKKDFKKNVSTILNQFYKNYKKEVTMLLGEIHDLYNGLMRSSGEIDKIFQIPLRLIKAKQNSYVRTENIHKEEFTNMIKGDDFVRLFFKFFKYANQEEYKPLKDKIFMIENELINSPKDLTKLREFISEYETGSKNSSKVEQNTEESKTHEMQSECSQYVDELKRIEAIKKRNEEKNKMSVDELVIFIESSDKNKSKKNKSKKNKEKNSKLKSDSPDVIVDREIELEIESFKHKLRVNSIHSKNIEKKKPLFTKEWLLSL